uniref:Uncharacterized protein n=1 Tax=Ditylenchus dipsaci TaxID=166011 RepID=A0A915EA67_9BILA
MGGLDDTDESGEMMKVAARTSVWTGSLTTALMTTRNKAQRSTYLKSPAARRRITPLPKPRRTRKPLMMRMSSRIKLEGSSASIR